MSADSSSASFERQAADVQGLIVSGYSHLIHTAYLFLEVTDAAKARAWLGWATQEVRTAKYEDVRGPTGEKFTEALNLAVTACGLGALGLPSAAVATFSQEFQEGITFPSRSRRLQDTGPNAPQAWDIGGAQSDGTPNEPMHLLLIFQTVMYDALQAYIQRHQVGFPAAGLRELHREFGYRHKEQHEHFGFLDGISQPDLGLRTGGVAEDWQETSALGEFVLGWPNSYGQVPPTAVVDRALDPNDILPVTGFDPAAKDLGRNGTYLVFRKLKQDVAGFRRYFRDRFDDPAEREMIEAKFIGRWKSGAPLALTPNHDDPSLAKPPLNNNFGYAVTDPEGFGCPIGSHVRRANPRDAFADTRADSITQVGRHRIIRRGNAYGERLPTDVFEDDGQERGLLFVCLNADINRQFELVQQSWINNPRFNGLYNDADPTIGPNTGRTTMTIQREPVRLRLTDVPQFVTVRGGGYFFMPSISALRFLAGL